MYSRLIARRSASTALVALLVVLAVGSSLSLAMGPSSASGQEGGTPTSMGFKCGACKLLGCPDTSTTFCASLTTEVNAEIAAEIKKILGITLGVGATLTIQCYQGASFCGLNEGGSNEVGSSGP